MGWLEALQYPFLQRAIIGVFFAGMAFPLMGVFVITLNLVPLRFAMMHVALLGGALGLFLNIDPVLPGLLFCAIASLALGPASEKMNMELGTLSGFFMTLTLALAFILFYKGNVHVLQAFSILWGNVLSLSPMELILVVAVSLCILAIVTVLFKEIQAILYDREVALAVGIPEKGIYYLLVFILGLSIAISMRMIGALLVDAFVLLPAMGASLISRSLKQLFLFSSLFGVVSGMGGLYLSFLIDVPASSMIILCASFIIFVCVLLRRRIHVCAKSENA